METFTMGHEPVSCQAVGPLVAASKLSKEQGQEARGTKAALQILVGLDRRMRRPSSLNS